jgi:hypothetical protein
VPAYPGAEHSDAARIHARQMVPRQRRPGRS